MPGKAIENIWRRLDFSCNKLSTVPWLILHFPFFFPFTSSSPWINVMSLMKSLLLCFSYSVSICLSYCCLASSGLWGRLCLIRKPQMENDKMVFWSWKTFFCVHYICTLLNMMTNSCHLLYTVFPWALSIPWISIFLASLLKIAP